VAKTIGMQKRKKKCIFNDFQVTIGIIKDKHNDGRHRNDQIITEQSHRHYRSQCEFGTNYHPFIRLHTQSLLSLKQTCLSLSSSPTKVGVFETVWAAKQHSKTPSDKNRQPKKKITQRKQSKLSFSPRFSRA